MGAALIIVVTLVVGALALGFYLDWFGLWVSEEEMTQLRAAANARMQASVLHNGNTAADLRLRALSSGGFRVWTTPRSFETARKNQRKRMK